MSELLPCKLCGVVPVHRADGLIAHGTWNSECPLWESSWMTPEQWTNLMGHGEPIAQVSLFDGKKCVTFYSYDALHDTPLWTKLFAAPPQAQGDDTARLSWLIRKLSGKALRDAGVIYSAGSETIRAAIDDAMK